MYMYMYMYMYIYMFFVCICTRVYVYVCIYIYIYIFQRIINYNNFCRIHHVVLYRVKNLCTYYRQPQQMLLVPSLHAPCFGRTDRHQALNTCYLKHKINIHFYFEF